jgi:DNA (cytosine-5)-methyltransferase 1
MPNRRQIHAADLFCGAGGTSAGLLDACEELNQTLHLTAINHWQVAVQTHRKNLPIAQHLCAELDQVNPMKVMKGKRLDLLVASPECTHHSVARGGRPINDQSRASAWVILKWIQELRIDNVLIENVKEFRDWGPLDYRGRPMKSRKGAIYLQFINCLKACGYTVEDNILNCANYGDATTRERLFIMAKRGNKRISWPEATHSAAGGTDMYGHTMKKWRAAREIIDWERKGESIYSRKRPLKATTLARIYAGIDKFCGPLIAEAFLRDVSSQFPTTLVKEFLVILRRHGDARSIDEPIPTLCAGGNHVGVAQFVLQQQSGGVPRDVAEPLPTIATGGAISKVDAFVLSAGGPKVGARHVNDPLNTVLTRDHMALAECIIPQFSDHAAKSVDDPLGTLTTTSRGIGLAEFQLNIDHHGGRGNQVRSLDQPIATQTTKARTCLVQPFVLPPDGPQMSYKPQARSTDEPLNTVRASRGAGHLVEAFIAKVNHGNGDDPNGDARRCYPLDEPLGVVTTQNGYAMVAPSIVKYNGTGKANSVEEPLDTVSTRDRFGLVEPKLTPDYRVEVLFRMLQPNELAAAHSMQDFRWPEGTNKSDIVKMIGNAVPRLTAKALCKELLA